MGNIGHGEKVFQVNYCSVPQLSEQKARGDAAHDEGILTTGRAWQEEQESSCLLKEHTRGNKPCNLFKAELVAMKNMIFSILAPGY